MLRRRLCGTTARQLVCCGVCAIYVHLAMLLLLAVWVPDSPQPAPRQSVTLKLVGADWGRPEVEILTENPAENPTDESSAELDLSFDQPTALAGLPMEAAPIDWPAFVPQAFNIPAPKAGVNATLQASSEARPETEQDQARFQTNTTVKVGGGYEGRMADARGRLAAARGGTPASEKAVELGLQWLAAHQQENGGWHFRHHEGACRGRCSHAGTHQSTTAATGLALLAFLGAGQTSREGVHQEVVARGLDYLVSRQVPNRRGGDLQEGTMYAQGIATMALCEAYTMTGDARLREPARLAIDYIVNVQHPLGGWRYFPGQPGDTTVLGWQLLALQSGKLAGLRVPPKSFELAYEFLDRVQEDQGAAYGYQGPGHDRSPTAVGLLGRMVQGWPRNDERLQRGLTQLAAAGPDEQDLYLNYYATQGLHHAGGPMWEQWNSAQRDRLVSLQAKEGHEAGSWYTADHQTTAGGRLCDTALAIMILEVYYRHLPLYGYRNAGELW